MKTKLDYEPYDSYKARPHLSIDDPYVPMAESETVDLYSSYLKEADASLPEGYEPMKTKLDYEPYDSYRARPHLTIDDPYVPMADLAKIDLYSSYLTEPVDSVPEGYEPMSTKLDYEPYDSYKPSIHIDDPMANTYYTAGGTDSYESTYSSPYSGEESFTYKALSPKLSKKKASKRRKGKHHYDEPNSDIAFVDGYSALTAQGVGKSEFAYEPGATDNIKRPHEQYSIDQPIYDDYREIHVDSGDPYEKYATGHAEYDRAAFKEYAKMYTETTYTPEPSAYTDSPDFNYDLYKLNYTTQEDPKVNTAPANMPVIAPAVVATSKQDQPSYAEANVERATAARRNLAAERERLEQKLKEMESAHEKNLANLAARERAAEVRSMEMQMSAREAAYKSDISRLNARMIELEKKHLQRENELRNSISEYEMKIADSEAAIKAHEEIAAAYTTGKPIKAVVPAAAPEAAPEVAPAAAPEVAAPEVVAPVEFAAPVDDAAYVEHQENKKLAREIAKESAQIRAAKEIVAIDKKNLAKQLKKSAAVEKKLAKKAAAKLKKAKHKKGEARILLQTDYLAIQKLLVESYANDYRLCLEAGNKKQKKNALKKLETATAAYNVGVDNWSALTETVAPKCPATLADDIAAGNVPVIAPVVYVKPGKKGKKAKAEPKASRKDMEKEACRFEKEDAERDKMLADLKADEVKAFEPVSKKAFKKQTEKDIATIKAKIAYRCDKITEALTASKYTFLAEKGKEKAAKRDAMARIKAMKRAEKALIKNTNKDAKRFLELINTDPAKCKARRSADRERMAELRQRIMSLLAQKEDINARLCAAYTDSNEVANESKKAKKKSKNVRKKIAAVKLKATKRAYKKQQKTFKKVSRMNLTLAKKEEIYTLMDKKTELAAYLAECNYRVKHEKSKGDAKRALVAEVKATKRRIKINEKDLASYTAKAARRSEKTPSAASKLGWIIVLLLIAGAAVAAYMFGPQIMELVKGFIG